MTENLTRRNFCKKTGMLILSATVLPAVTLNSEVAQAGQFQMTTGPSQYIPPVLGRKHAALGHTHDVYLDEKFINDPSLAGRRGALLRFSQPKEKHLFRGLSGPFSRHTHPHHRLSRNQLEALKRGRTVRFKVKFLGRLDHILLINLNGVSPS